MSHVLSILKTLQNIKPCRLCEIERRKNVGTGFYDVGLPFKVCEDHKILVEMARDNRSRRRGSAELSEIIFPEQTIANISQKDILEAATVEATYSAPALKDLFRIAYTIIEDMPTPLMFDNDFALKTRFIDPSHIMLVEATLMPYDARGNVNDFNRRFNVDTKLVNNFLKTNSLKKAEKITLKKTKKHATFYANEKAQFSANLVEDGEYCDLKLNIPITNIIILDRKTMLECLETVKTASGYSDPNVKLTTVAQDTIQVTVETDEFNHKQDVPILYYEKFTADEHSTYSLAQLLSVLKAYTEPSIVFKFSNQMPCYIGEVKDSADIGVYMAPRIE